MRVFIFFTCGLLFLFGGEKPAWISSPQNDKYLGGVGIVESIDQRSTAIILARAELLESLKVEISSLFTQTKSKTSSDAKRVITQKAQGFLKESFPYKSYTDEDGNYYVWVVIKRDSLK